MPPYDPTHLRRMLVRLTLTLGLLLPHAAHAWEIDTSRSFVTFRYIEGGIDSSGTFNRIGGTLDYTQGQAEDSKADIQVETTSLDLGDILREGILATKPWLDSGGHPHARFILDSLDPLGGDRYTATGSLEIKGKTWPTQFTLTLENSDTEARVHGELAFKRSNYDLRDILLESLVTIGETVRLDFNIVALREPDDIR